MSNNALAVQLPRVLGARDVVLLYTIAIVSLQWLSTAALSFGTVSIGGVANPMAT